MIFLTLSLYLAGLAGRLGALVPVSKPGNLLTITTPSPTSLTLIR
jgi:hypothetical protein